MKDMFFIQLDDNGISLSSNMLAWIDPPTDNHFLLVSTHKKSQNLTPSRNI